MLCMCKVFENFPPGLLYRFYTVSNKEHILFQQPEILRDKLQENEKLMKEMSLTWEEKLTKTGQTQEDRRQALEKLGISVQSSGIKVEKNKCYLVNLNR